MVNVFTVLFYWVTKETKVRLGPLEDKIFTKETRDGRDGDEPQIAY